MTNKSWLSPQTGLENTNELAGMCFCGSEAEIDALRAENERLRAVLLRLVELGEDDGSATDSAWKDAFTHAAQLVARK